MKRFLGNLLLVAMAITWPVACTTFIFVVAAVMAHDAPSKTPGTDAIMAKYRNGGCSLCQRAAAAAKPKTVCGKPVQGSPMPVQDQINLMSARIYKLEQANAKLEAEVKSLHQVRLIMEREEITVEEMELPPKAKGPPALPPCDGNCGDDCDCGPLPGGSPCNCNNPIRLKAKKERKARR